MVRFCFRFDVDGAPSELSKSSDVPLKLGGAHPVQADPSRYSCFYLATDRPCALIESTVFDCASASA